VPGSRSGREKTMLRLAVRKRISGNGQRGIALVESLVSLALLGIIAVAFLSGTQMTSTSRVQADDRASAKIIAESVMDNVKQQVFASEYTVTLPAEYSGYDLVIDVEHIKNNNIQHITVQVSRGGTLFFELEGYKVQR
jgi:type II secretory pathway pseudopilin PulG